MAAPKSEEGDSWPNKNICIGKDAGLNLTTESNMLVIKSNGIEVERKMTDEEYELVEAVVRGMSAVFEERETGWISVATLPPDNGYGESDYVALWINDPENPFWYQGRYDYVKQRFHSMEILSDGEITYDVIKKVTHWKTIAPKDR